MSLRPAWCKDTADWCLHALSESNFISVGHTQFARVGLIENKRAFFFQYSNDAKDWCDNLNIALQEVEAPDGREAHVHAGFLAQFMAIRVAIAEADLYLGHSLGAAIATIAGWYWQKPVIAMASPRVGGKAFVKQADPYVLRLSNTGDPVTHLPAWWMGYRHTGQNVGLKPRKRNIWGWIFGDWMVHMPQEYAHSIANAREALQ
jgi:predicted lipase